MYISSSSSPKEKNKPGLALASAFAPADPRLLTIVSKRLLSFSNNVSDFGRADLSYPLLLAFRACGVERTFLVVPPFLMVDPDELDVGVDGPGSGWTSW